MSQKPTCIWFTGLSGSGKSTLGTALEQRVRESGQSVYMLDGDQLRLGLNRDLGFTERDRAENVRRVAEVARLMVDAGLVVIVTLISPFRAERDFARSLFQADEFLEVYVDTSLAVCEQRDPKGLYAQVRAGQLTHFTGISSPYEPPLRPDLCLSTMGDRAIDVLMTKLETP